MKRGGVSSIYSPETTGKANTSIWSISSSGTLKRWRRHIRLNLLKPLPTSTQNNRINWLRSFLEETRSDVSLCDDLRHYHVLILHWQEHYGVKSRHMTEICHKHHQEQTKSSADTDVWTTKMLNGTSLYRSHPAHSRQLPEKQASDPLKSTLFPSRHRKQPEAPADDKYSISTMWSLFCSPRMHLFG